MSEAKKLQPHADRLLPADPATRDIARGLYDQVKDLPIISPHGHVPPKWLSENTPFSDPTSLLITPDHYVNRLMHASGVDLADLGVGQDEFTPEQSRNAFRILASHWDVYRGTPVKYWLENVLYDTFDVRERPSADNADAIYDQIAGKLTLDEYKPRALFERFNITFLATTDDPADDLHEHREIADGNLVDGTVVPTFRPDKYLEPAREDWNQLVDRLGEVSGIATDTFAGWCDAMANRRRHFKDHGAVSSDHSHADPGTTRLSDAEAEASYAKARAGEITNHEADALRRTFMFEQMRMATEDGLVMTLHPGVFRNHHTPTFAKFGADVGTDIPMAVEFTKNLQPGLAAFGGHPNFQLVLFTIDETVYSRELAPLAGFYPSVYVGAPWWFIDEADAMTRFREAVTGTLGFTRTSGFIDDTRAFCSIPVRHDLSRRVDASFIAKLVAEHRLEIDEAEQAIVDLVVNNPKEAFKL